LTPVGFRLFFCSYAISNYACKCFRFIWYSFFSSSNFSFSAFVTFLLSSSDYNRDTFFKFTNSKFVKTLSFSFFSLVNAFTWLPKTSYCCLWRNNAFVHFLSVVFHIFDFCFKSCSFSSCDFNHIVLPLNFSFLSYSFLTSILIFCSIFALFFLHISTLCLYPFWKSLSLFNSSYSIAFSFSFITNPFFILFTSKIKFPVFKLTIAMV
jgi:hypothetical protein